MTKTWILVAHRSGARILENKGPRKRLELLQQIEHPEGRLKNHEINSDKSGRGFDGKGVEHHAYSNEHAPTEHVAEQFAKQLSEVLEHGRTRRRFDKLVLVAEPRFLGNLRAAIPAQTAALISATMDKDLGGVETRDLPKHLNGVVRLVSKEALI